MAAEGSIANGPALVEDDDKVQKGVGWLLKETYSKNPARNAPGVWRELKLAASASADVRPDRTKTKASAEADAAD